MSNQHRRALLIFCGALSRCLAQTAPQPAIAITHVNVVDVVAGELRIDQTVVIVSAKIASLGPAASIAVPRDATVIAASGEYLMPGLWDMHVHLRSDQNTPDSRMSTENEAMLDLFLPNGVVGICEMGGDLADDVIRWREEVRAGKREGPRILTAGRKLDNDPPAWAGSIGVKTPDEARQAVQQIKQSGADFVKVYFRTIPADVFKAVIDEAHRQHLKVTGHKPTNMSIQELIETGVDGMQHAEYLPAPTREAYDELQRERARRAGTVWAMDPTESAARLLDLQDSKEGERVYQSMAQKQFWVTPTLSIYTHTLEHGTRDYETDERKRFFFPGIWRTWDPKVGMRKPAESRALALRQEGVKRWEKATLAAYKAGVPMTLGTDCGANNDHQMPGWSAHEELEAFVRIGLTPAEALRLATVNPAKWRGDAEEGAVEQGKVADMLLLRSNPLSNIRHTKEIESVFQGGRYYSRAKLEAMLRRAEERATAAAAQQKQVIVSH
jgi:imidazolonepropionase-like amidohydrolase